MVERQLNFLNYPDETVKGYEEPIFKKRVAYYAQKY